jgi:hypothetical protein
LVHDMEVLSDIYAFPSIVHTGLSSEQFAKRLLEEEGVITVPGSAFGPGSRDDAYEQRIKPSPPGPNAEPGTVITPSSSNSRARGERSYDGVL